MACASTNGESDYDETYPTKSSAVDRLATNQLEDNNSSCPTPWKRFEIRMVTDDQPIKQNIADDIKPLKLQFLVLYHNEHLKHAIEKVKNVKNCSFEDEGLIINIQGDSKGEILQIIIDVLANEADEIIAQRSYKRNNTVCLLERQLKDHLKKKKVGLFCDGEHVFIVAYTEIERDVKNAIDHIDEISTIKKKYTRLSINPLILKLLLLDLARDIFNRNLFRHGIRIEWHVEDDQLYFYGTGDDNPDMLKAVLHEQFMLTVFSDSNPFTECKGFELRIYHNSNILVHEKMATFIYLASTKEIILQILNAEKEFHRLPSVIPWVKPVNSSYQRQTSSEVPEQPLIEYKKWYCIVGNPEERYQEIRDVVKRIEKDYQCHITMRFDSARPQQIGQWVHVDKNIHLVLVEGNIDSILTDVMIVPRTSTQREEISRCDVIYLDEPGVGMVKYLEKIKAAIKKMDIADNKKQRTITIHLRLSNIRVEETFLLYFCDVLYHKPPQYVKTIYLVLEDPTKKFASTKLLTSGLPTWKFYDLVLMEDIEGYENIKINEALLPRRINTVLVEGDLVDQQVDVIVNSTNTELNLEKGTISNLILKKAGNTIADECKREFPKGVEYGEVVKTSGGKLKCKSIYHFALPKWTTNAQFSIQVLIKAMFKCLEMASKDRHTSIAFPVFGTGILQYPWNEVADAMFTSVNSFDKMFKDTSLKDVRIVLFKDDQKSTKACRERQSMKTHVDLIPEDPSAFALERREKDIRILTLVQSEVAPHHCDAIVIVLAQKNVCQYVKDHPPSKIDTCDIETDKPKGYLYWKITVRSENTTTSLRKALNRAVEFAVEERLSSLAIRLMQDHDSPTCKKQFDVVKDIITDKTRPYLQVIKLLILKSNEEMFHAMDSNERKKSNTKFRPTPRPYDVDMDKPKLLLTVEAYEDSVFNDFERRLSSELRMF